MIQEEGELTIAYGSYTELTAALDYPEVYKTFDFKESKLKILYVEKFKSLVDLLE